MIKKLIGAVLIVFLTTSLIIKSSDSAEVDIPDGDVTALVNAIVNANNSAEDDIINLAPGGTYTLTAPDNDINGLPSISNAASSGSLTINGNGATIQRVAADNVRFRIFNISSNGSLILNDLTVMGGFTPDADGTQFNTNGRSGGGINNRGTLVLMNSNVLNNRTGDGLGSITSTAGTFPGSGGPGGGINNDAGGSDSGNGVLELINSTVSGNITGNGADGTSGVDGGFGGFGGGIFNGPFATLSMTGSTVSNNTTGNGGAGTSTSSDGRGGDGGGIYIQGDGPLEIFSGTISGNQTGNSGMSSGTGSSGGGGGGIFVNNTPFIIVNSTVSGNTTGNGDTTMDAGGSGGNGGGIHISAGSDFEVNIINTTITDNMTGSGSNSINAINGGNGGGIFNQQNNNTVTNTIIAGNSVAPGGRGPNCDNSPVMDGGNNLSNDNNPGDDGLGECFDPTAGTNTLTNFDVANCLGLLANNGGLTLTHALIPSGVNGCMTNLAIDGGDNATCASDTVGNLDQRSFPRPSGSNCDIGAFELQQEPFIKITKLTDSTTTGTTFFFELNTDPTTIFSLADGQMFSSVLSEGDFGLTEINTDGFIVAGVECTDESVEPDITIDNSSAPTTVMVDFTLMGSQRLECTITNTVGTPGGGGTGGGGIPPVFPGPVDEEIVINPGEGGPFAEITVSSGIPGGGSIFINLPDEVLALAASLVPNIASCEIVGSQTANVEDADVVCDIDDFPFDIDVILNLCRQGNVSGVAEAVVEVISEDRPEENTEETIEILLNDLELCQGTGDGDGDSEPGGDGDSSGDGEAGGDGCSVVSNTTKTSALSNFVVTLIPAIVGFGAMLFRRRKD